MATTKKSTNAKTKTSAAKARTTKATAAKRAPAKTTKKAAPAKVAVKPVANASGLLTRLNAVSAVVSVALAGAAGFLMGNTSYELVSGLQAKNELVSDGSAPFASAVNHVADLEIRWALVAVLALSAIVPILALTVKKAQYAAAIKNSVNLWRWIDTAVVGALMIEVTALLSGINEIMTLKLLAGFMLVTGALAWVTEKRVVQAGRPVKSELILGIVTSVMPWILIGSYAIGTYAYGLVRSPWYVYALYAALLVGFAGYCHTLKRWVKGKTSDYAVAERNYLAIGIVTKLAFAIILIVGLAK